MLRAFSQLSSLNFLVFLDSLVSASVRRDMGGDQPRVEGEAPGDKVAMGPAHRGPPSHPEIRWQWQK